MYRVCHQQVRIDSCFCIVMRYNSALMVSGRHGCEIAVLTVICVLMIFFFPVMQGPYSVLHGPVTALRAARAAVHLRLAIVQAALKLPRRAT